MQDNEIIKALENCLDVSPSCTACRYDGDSLTSSECMGALMKDALKLIKHQKAEIERLTDSNRRLRDDMRMMLNNDNGSDQIRAEAIKDFAERLKIEAFECDVSFGYGKECYQQAVAVIEIDNLVKEMTEEGDSE